MKKLTAPTQNVFLFSVALAILALIAYLVKFALSPYAFWILLAAFVVLAIACLAKNF
jgi:hypothetical protein